MTLREAWELDGATYEVIARGRTETPYMVAQWIRAQGFYKCSRGSTYTEGPCVECQVVHQRDEIGPDYRCDACRTKQADATRSGPYHIARWGLQPDPGHSDWIALERIASRYRMRDPERVERLRPVRCYLPGGALPGGPMPGVLR